MTGYFKLNEFFNGLNEMFDYIINEAEYLLKDNCLPLIEDPDDDTEDEEK